jgi:hypothetical protein
VNQEIKEESSFLKKRSKRLLFLRCSQDPGHDTDLAASADIKVFWFFFSKKNAFATYEAIPLRPQLF